MLSYLRKPLMILPAIMELTSLFCVKQRKFVLNSKVASHKNVQNWPYVEFNIIFPNMPIVLPISVFYTKHLAPYAISVYLNLSAYVLLSHYFVAKKILYSFSLKMESNSLCSWISSGVSYRLYSIKMATLELYVYIFVLMKNDQRT